MIDLDDFLRKLSQIVKTEMDRTGLVQSQFAERLNLTQGTISKLEGGNYISFPKLEVLIAIANFKGIALWELIKMLEESAEVDLPENPKQRKQAIIAEINQGHNLTDSWEIVLAAIKNYDKQFQAVRKQY